jgi:hypothetical protein
LDTSAKGTKQAQERVKDAAKVQQQFKRSHSSEAAQSLGFDAFP